ncbi:hypothetical protein HPB51_008633 [Rhipicephalus microplus]|uniref:CCHC-type domain-containing protein n=2 Tax=Rhipicephalus microplus TaxID=6941 RepID=A0A9J6EN67_RHIMP|nr:hypothetical protein HPB51_008633 [Rhipicephalus microplus]
MLGLTSQNHTITSDAVAEDSGIFDNLGLFNVHPNLSTRGAYSIFTAIENSTAAAGIRYHNLRFSGRVYISHLTTAAGQGHSYMWQPPALSCSDSEILELIHSLPPFFRVAGKQKIPTAAKLAGTGSFTKLPVSLSLWHGFSFEDYVCLLICLSECLSLAPPAKDRPAGRPGRGRGVAPKHSSSGHHRRPGLTTLGAVHFNIVRGTLARTVPASRRLHLAAATLPCSSCEPVTMAAAELKTQPSQPSSAPKRSAKRVADSQMGIDDLSASATPASKRECPSPAAVASPGTESKYKVVVKPRECFDVSKLSNRLLQSAFDTCLKTTAFQGFSIHHPTNSVSVWVRSLADVDRLTHLQTLPVTADCTVQVQAYLSSGSDLRRYVVSGVDPGESPEGLITALTCSTHKIVTARYMGRGRTCLVTLQGPRTPPSRITYYGCILKFHVYKPGVVHCYRCFRTGHMRDSCPQPADTSMESVETRTYKCGLCQTDDHEITSKDCPVKQKALKARRQRKRRQRSVTQEERDADIPTSNRFELLSPSEEDTPALVEPENACYEVPTYSDAVKRGKKRVQQPANTPKLSVTGTDDLAKLDQQIQQLQMEVKRLAQRRTHLARPAGPTAMRGTDVPYAASVPELSCASASAPVKMTPAELLHFVARQLQELSKVVLANLPPQ